MKLRRLEMKDASLMLEWMHDKSVVEDLRTNFLTKTLSDCEKFIISSWSESNSINLAIVDDFDEYMGTVGLKNICGEQGEFTITIRKTAMGKGYSKFAIEEMIRIAFEEKCLNHVYWCVSPNNKRAVRFYDKNDYQRVSAKTLNITGEYTCEQIDSYVWYSVSKHK